MMFTTDGEIMTNKNKLAVIYARSARANPAVILAQILECAEKAAEEGMLIAGIFQEDCVGATGDRPGLQRMMQFLRSRHGEKTVVITANPSRIARSIDQYEEIQAAFEELNVECWAPFPPRDVAEEMKALQDAINRHSARKGRAARPKRTKIGK